MKIYTNKALKKLISKYLKVEDNNNFLSFEIPIEVAILINSEININKYGVGLKNTFQPTIAPEGLLQSYYEDDNNHFHVDWFIKKQNIKKCLELAIFTLKSLALNFEKKGIKGIRFWLSFSTKEILKNKFLKLGIHEEGDKYNISDRLSFYTLRKGENIISLNEIDNFEAGIMIIDI